MKSSFEQELEKHGSIVYPNTGHSMWPLIREGRDLMVIEKKGPDRCRKYDAVLFKRDNGVYVLHRILEVRDRGYYIVGDNCAKGEYVREDQVLGVMTAVVRDGKTVSVDDPAYQRYVHLWCDRYEVRSSVLSARDKLRRAASKVKRTIIPKK